VELMQGVLVERGHLFVLGGSGLVIVGLIQTVGVPERPLGLQAVVLTASSCRDAQCGDNREQDALRQKLPHRNPLNVLLVVSPTRNFVSAPV